jgi:GNAT superfamily N-acetyltransferase
VGGAVASKLTPPTPLAKIADRCELARFSCGEPPLDAWLKERALASEGRSARTYLVCSGARVVGYYCLAVGSIVRARLPRKLRHGAPEPVPVFILGRLAIDRSVQGQGLGKDLVAHCLRQYLSAAGIIGARALVVHALNDGLVPFYEGLGFEPLAGGDRGLFIPVETIADAFTD